MRSGSRRLWPALLAPSQAKACGYHATTNAYEGTRNRAATSGNLLRPVADTSSSDTATPFLLHYMKAALFLACSGPAAGALVLAIQDGPRARPATDAGIALVVKRIIRNVVLGDESPNVLVGPAQEWIDLGQSELFVPLDDAGGGAMNGLVAPD